MSTKRKKSPAKLTQLPKARPKRGLDLAGPRPPIEPERLQPFWDSTGTGYFAYRLILTAKLCDNTLIRKLSGIYPLTPPEIRVIAQLGLVGTGTVRGLAEGAFVDRAEVSRATRDLHRRRLLRRLPNKSDARSSVFALSSQGKRVSALVGKCSQDHAAFALEGVSEAELATVHRVLWQIANRCLMTDRPGEIISREWL